jgi:hypothetical protein
VAIDWLATMSTSAVMKRLCEGDLIELLRDDYDRRLLPCKTSAQVKCEIVASWTHGGSHLGTDGYDAGLDAVCGIMGLPLGTADGWMRMATANIADPEWRQCLAALVTQLRPSVDLVKAAMAHKSIRARLKQQPFFDLLLKYLPRGTQYAMIIECMAPKLDVTHLGSFLDHVETTVTGKAKGVPHNKRNPLDAWTRDLLRALAPKFKVAVHAAHAETRAQREAEVEGSTTAEPIKTFMPRWGEIVRAYTLKQPDPEELFEAVLAPEPGTAVQAGLPTSGDVGASGAARTQTAAATHGDDARASSKRPRAVSAAAGSSSCHAAGGSAELGGLNCGLVASAGVVHAAAPATQSAGSAPAAKPTNQEQAAHQNKRSKSSTPATGQSTLDQFFKPS